MKAIKLAGLIFLLIGGGAFVVYQAYSYIFYPLKSTEYSYLNGSRYRYACISYIDDTSNKSKLDMFIDNGTKCSSKQILDILNKKDVTQKSVQLCGNLSKLDKFFSESDRIFLKIYEY